MIGTPLTKTVKTDPDETQVVNGEIHQRVFSPIAITILSEILVELKINNKYLIQIVGEENEVTEEDIAQ